MNDTWRRPISNMPQAFQSYKPRYMQVYGSIIINELGEVLLVYGRRSNKWSFPKGHCKERETDLECAKRELLEETGVVIDTPYTSYHKLKGGSYFVFPVSGEINIKTTDFREIQSVKWWPLNALPITDSNVDVSIFRTLMRNIPSEDYVNEFIDSKEGHKKISNIAKRIQ